MEKEVTPTAFSPAALSDCTSTINPRGAERPVTMRESVMCITKRLHITRRSTADALRKDDRPASCSSRIRAIWVKVDKVGLVCRWTQEEDSFGA